MKKNKFYPLGGTTVFLVDQWAKHYVEKNLKMGEKRNSKPFSTTIKKKTDLPTRTSAMKITKRQKTLFLLSSLSRANTRIIALNM